MQVNRVYHLYSFSQLLRFKIFLRLVSFNVIVKNMRKIYSLSCRVLGNTITNKSVKVLFGDIFVGGENEKELVVRMKKLDQQGFFSISDYALEALSKEDNNLILSNINEFKKSIDSSKSVNSNNMVAMKISSLISLDRLRDLNSIQLYFSFLEENSSFDDFLKNLEAYQVQHMIPKEYCNKEKFTEMKVKTGELFSGLTNKSNMFKFNIFEYISNNKDKSKLSKIINLDVKVGNSGDSTVLNSLERIEKLLSDTKQIFDYGKQNNITLVIDAEQTYLQTAIEYLFNVLAFENNQKNDCYAINTFQMYLTTSSKKLKQSIIFNKDNNLNLGLKIVRGAYILEETRIANQQGYANPIYHSYSDTNNNYNEGVDYLIESCTEKDRIIFATHNKESIKILNEKLRKSGKISYKNICSAQLLGMGEETSFLSKDTYVS